MLHAYAPAVHRGHPPPDTPLAIRENLRHIPPATDRDPPGRR